LSKLRSLEELFVGWHFDREVILLCVRWYLRYITLDGYAASHRAVREMKDDGLLPRRTRLRSSKYLNNLVEQDHRGIKSRTRPMLGFKSFSSAAITIDGVELLRRIHKAQFFLSRLRLKDHSAPALWNAVLAA
jgi:transposase-like protein